MPRSQRLWFVERLKRQNEFEQNEIKKIQDKNKIKGRRIYSPEWAVRLEARDEGVGLERD